MFPIAKDKLSFPEIADYWSREIDPRASWKELFHILEAAFWLGEVRGDFVQSRLQLLKEQFTLMRDRDDAGVIFLVGNSAGPPPIELPDRSVTVDLRQQIRVPSGNIDNWNETSCKNAFQALAETRSLDSYPELAAIFAGVSLSYEEFTAWLAKRGFDKPTFWGPQQPKKHWQVKPGVELTKTEEAVLSAINELYPNGELDHKAGHRNSCINKHFKASGRSSVSPSTIVRTLRKIEFA
jgi:hypothetical protein